MTISDVAPTIGVVSNLATPLRSRLNSSSFTAGVAIGGSIVADTRSAPDTFWAGATAGTVGSVVRNTVTQSHVPEPERVRMLHLAGNPTSNLASSHTSCRHFIVTGHDTILTRDDRTRLEVSRESAHS